MFLLHHLRSVIIDMMITNSLTISVGVTYFLFKWLYHWDRMFLFLFIMIVCYLVLLPVNPPHTRNQHSLCNWFLTTSMVSPPQVIWEPTKPSRKQAIYLFAPHGNLPIGLLWLVGIHPFQENTYLLVSKKLFHWWASNLFCRFRGRILEISHTNITWCLQQGHSILLSLGGIQEMLLDHHLPHTMYLYTGHQRLFQYIRQFQLPVYPILCEGHQPLYNNPFKFISRWMYRYTGYPLPLLFTNQRMFPISNRVPLTIIIGKRIKKCTSKKLYSHYQRLCQKYIPHVSLVTTQEKI